MSLEKLAEISRFYGGNPEYVIAGGGNTSFKDDEFLYVKASGTSLAQSKPEDFVKMSRSKLALIWKKDYPPEPEAREADVLKDMMAGRCPGEENKRPSVETLLHDLLPFAYVVHLHPALVNGLSCSQEGQSAANKLFPDALWIPSINPGFILSQAVKKALDAKKGESQNQSVILLQNHGIFVAANTTEEIKKIYEQVMEVLGKKIKNSPDFSGEVDSFGNSEALGKEILNLARRHKSGAEWFIKFSRNRQIEAFTADEASFKPISSAFSPDHIVYYGSEALFINDTSKLETAFKAFLEKTSKVPQIIAVKSLGVFGLAISQRALGNALELFKDSQKIAVFSMSFGGPRFMDDDKIDFINNWEMERYRSKVST